MEKTIELFAGIDVGKHKVDVHFHPTNEAFTAHTDTDDGLAHLIDQLKSRSPKRVVFESTGGYGRLLGEALEEAGVKAHCVPAQRIRMFASAIGLKAKTDPIDAEAIARFAAAAKLPDKVELSPATKELRHLVVRRLQLVKMIAREKNHRETMTESLTESSSELERAVNKHVGDIEDAMVAVVNADDDLRKRATVLSTITGGGGIAGASALLALLPELGTINNKQAASLVGLAPFNNQSVDADKPRSIFGGRRRLRSAVYMCILTAALRDEKLSAFYARLIENKKPPMVALIAVARKFVVIANARMRDAIRAKTIDECSVLPKPWKPRRKQRGHKPRATSTPERKRRKSRATSSPLTS